jgi:flagellin
MALGVLNNLSAIYAEHNLNNTNNSLQQVLQQLSSGSRINSGADDAAGLSLVNGLAANAAALTQSTTNVAEGVGLLQVADGALSQVTNLLNRAVTLATEAANGTLNQTQESATNQEYQSILAEISNIGSTTTYNQQQVFSGNTIAIYTGDSSTTGSSIDELNIRSLSQSSIGDRNGRMSYTSGQNNVFLNFSTASTNAQVSDFLNASGSTTIDVNYLVKSGSSGSGMASTQISVGAGTGYANTVGGLINAIDNAGLGLTATFATQADAGVIGGGMQTGIQIAGGLVSAGVVPGSVSTSGMLNPNGVPANQLLTQGQVITVAQGGNEVAQVTISPSINTLLELATAINAQAGAGTASVVTNGDGTVSLALNDTASTQGSLSVTVQAGGGAVPVFGAPTVATDAPTLATPSGVVAGTAAVTGIAGSVTFGTSGTNAGTDVLSDGGNITLTNSSTGAALTFIVGNGIDTATTFYTNGNGNTMSGLISTINSQSGGSGRHGRPGCGQCGHHRDRECSGYRGQYHRQRQHTDSGQQ